MATGPDSERALNMCWGGHISEKSGSFLFTAALHQAEILRAFVVPQSGGWHQLGLSGSSKNCPQKNPFSVGGVRSLSQNFLAVFFVSDKALCTQLRDALPRTFYGYIFHVCISFFYHAKQAWGFRGQRLDIRIHSIGFAALLCLCGQMQWRQMPAVHPTGGCHQVCATGPHPPRAH